MHYNCHYLGWDPYFSCWQLFVSKIALKPISYIFIDSTSRRINFTLCRYHPHSFLLLSCTFDDIWYYYKLVSMTEKENHILVIMRSSNFLIFDSHTVSPGQALVSRKKLWEFLHSNFSFLIAPSYDLARIFCVQWKQLKIVFKLKYNFEK